MSYTTLDFDLAEGVATIVLNRPPANALDLAMAEELHDIAVRCSTDRAIRAVLLTGSGEMFCAGGDLKAFLGAEEGLPAFVTKTATVFHAAETRFAHMDPPLTIAVNGTAAGAGFSLALAGDYAIAAETARYVSAYTASGLTPDGGATYYLAKHVGLMRAKELVLTNRVLTAAEALDWGLVNRVVPADRLREEATALARKFAAGPTRAYGGAKRLLATAFSEPFEAQTEKETRSIAEMMQTEDGAGGLKAFAEKRKPEFRGE